MLGEVLCSQVAAAPKDCGRQKQHVNFAEAPKPNRVLCGFGHKASLWRLAKVTHNLEIGSVANNLTFGIPNQVHNIYSRAVFENLLFTSHALNRMLERGVSASQIQRVLDAPDSFRPGQPGTTVLSKQFEDLRILKVFVAGDFPIDVPTIIVTVAWKD